MEDRFEDGPEADEAEADGYEVEDDEWVPDDEWEPDDDEDESDLRSEVVRPFQIAIADFARLLESVAEQQESAMPQDADDSEGATVGTVAFDVVLAIVEEELRSELGLVVDGDPTVDEEFAALISAEFGEVVPVPCPIELPDVTALARLIHDRVGSLPFRWMP